MRLASSITLLVATSTTLVSAGSIKLLGKRSAGQNEAYKTADGKFIPEFVRNESEAVKRKYNQHREILLKKAAQDFNAPAKKVRNFGKKRSNGAVDLTDRIQGGVDEEYFGNIQIGTPFQTLPVDFDTGSSDLWLPVVAISGSGGEFNSQASSSFLDTRNQFQITYGSGNVAGTVASDVVNLAGLTVQTQTIGAVTTESSQFNGDPSAGIFGLAFSSIAQTGQPTVVENLISSGQLDSNLIAFHYTRGQSSGSELSVGATDSSHFTGDITYTKVTSQTYWEVQVSGSVVNGQSVGPSFSAAIDTGTTLIYLPTAAADAIYNAIPGSSSDGSGSYTIPCSSTNTVAFVFGGSTKVFEINAADLTIGSTGDGSTCAGAIMGADNQDQNGNNFAIIGDSFLKNWYTVFSYDAANGSPAVGFAQNV